MINQFLIKISKLIGNQELSKELWWNINSLPVKKLPKKIDVLIMTQINIEYNQRRRWVEFGFGIPIAVVGRQGREDWSEVITVFLVKF